MHRWRSAIVHNVRRRTYVTMTNIHEFREVAAKPSDYQPSKAELEEEFDMPGADMETLREAFFKPLKTEEKRNA